MLPSYRHRLASAKQAEAERTPLNRVKALIDIEPTLSVNVSAEVGLRVSNRL
jgi:hypothetical protein